MFAPLKLEHAADNVHWQHVRGGMSLDFARWLRDWRKLGPDKSFTSVERLLPNGKRQHIRGVPDYTSANHNGSRGVFYWYTLEEGVYYVTHRYEMNAVRRYWLLSEDGETHEITKQEAMAWALQQSRNDTLASPF